MDLYAESPSQLRLALLRSTNQRDFDDSPIISQPYLPLILEHSAPTKDQEDHPNLKLFIQSCSYLTLKFSQLFLHSSESEDPAQGVNNGGGSIYA